jgi:hypothetical protein
MRSAVVKMQHSEHERKETMTLAEELNGANAQPNCEKGQVTVAIGDTQLTGYVGEHPEGSDRGGYVPTVFRESESSYYDSATGEWLD